MVKLKREVTMIIIVQGQEWGLCRYKKKRPRGTDVLHIFIAAPTQRWWFCRSAFLRRLHCVRSQDRGHRACALWHYLVHPDPCSGVLTPTGLCQEHRSSDPKTQASITTTKFWPSVWDGDTFCKCAEEASVKSSDIASRIPCKELHARDQCKHVGWWVMVPIKDDS